MDKELRCRDVGLDCDSSVCGKTEDEVLTRAGQHVLNTHGIQGFSKEFFSKAKTAIREGDCEFQGAGAGEVALEGCSDCYEEYVNCDECCC